MIHPRISVVLSVYYALARAASGCSVPPRNGTLIDSIQATSDPTLLVANVGLYEATSHEPIIKKKATINLQNGAITPGWPEDAVEIFRDSGTDPVLDPEESLVDEHAITVYPHGPLEHQAAADTSGWTFDLDETRDPPVATVIGPYGHGAAGGGGMSPRTAALYPPMAQFELPHLDPSSAEEDGGGGLFWFVSARYARVYVFYNNATTSATNMMDPDAPPAVAAIAPLTGGGPALYVPYSETVTGAEQHGRTMKAYDDIQIAAVPADASCGHANAVFYTEDSVEVRANLFNFGVQYEGRKMALAYDSSDGTALDTAYKIENNPEHETFALTKIILSTGEESAIVQVSEEDVSALLAVSADDEIVVIDDFLLAQLQICPAERPSSLDTCSGMYMCSYGEDCCCGECHSSIKCSCHGGSFACIEMGKCFNPKCDEDSTVSSNNEEPEGIPAHEYSSSSDENDSVAAGEDSTPPAGHSQDEKDGSGGNNAFNIGVKSSGPALRLKVAHGAWISAAMTACALYMLCYLI